MSCALTKRTRSNGFPCRVPGLRHLGGALSRVAVPSCPKDSLDVYLEVFQACHTRRRLQSRSRTHWRDYVLHLAWEKLGIPLEKLESVARRKHVWNTQFSFCHCDLTSDKKSKMTDDCFNLIILIIWLEVQKYIKVSMIIVV